VAAVAATVLVAVSAARLLRPATVIVSPVVRGTAIEAVYATGTVEAVDRVTVKAKSAGTILQLTVREGARVSRGDLLASIDVRPLRADLSRARAEASAAALHAAPSAPQVAMLEAQAQVLASELAQARSDADRLERLATEGSAPAAELDRARTRIAVLDAQLTANEAQRRALRIDLSARALGASAAAESLEARVLDAEVRAPLTGVILARDVEPGEVVSLNQPLFRIGDVNRLVLECAIDEADVGKVTVGNPAHVSLYAFPQRSFSGRVSEILPDADRTKKSFLVKVELDDAPPRLRSGMTAEVNIVVEERAGALLAPAEAVDATGTAWAVVDGRARRRAVRTGVRDLVRVELLEGAREGEHLALAPVEALADGMRVRAVVQASGDGAQAGSRPPPGGR
jgi:HlyD family secretion protein